MFWKTVRVSWNKKVCRTIVCPKHKNPPVKDFFHGAKFISVMILAPDLVALATGRFLFHYFNIDLSVVFSVIYRSILNQYAASYM